MRTRSFGSRKSACRGFTSNVTLMAKAPKDSEAGGQAVVHDPPRGDVPRLILLNDRT